MTEQFQVIAEAFSRTAVRYDAFALDHPNLTRARGKVYAHLARILPPGARILEINGGTGTDAFELARRGFIIHVSDIAPGMLERAAEKARQAEAAGRMTVQQCSFTDLAAISGAPYDAVFSNFGGLNCLPDLTPVIRQLPAVLKPGGIVSWVLMPPVCLWEMAEALRGHFKLAFRRFNRRGVLSHLEGLHFRVYYFSPRQVSAWFGDTYKLLALEGISVITPTTETKNFPKQHPQIYAGLAWLDDRLAPRFPWNGWGDFYIVSLRYQPASSG